MPLIEGETAHSNIGGSCSVPQQEVEVLKLLAICSCQYFMALEKCCLLCSDPALVGKAFVKQYYTQMHRDPSQMHRFYLDQSSFVHGGSEIGSEEPVIGQKVCGKREGREGERRENWKERFWRGGG